MRGPRGFALLQDAARESARQRRSLTALFFLELQRGKPHPQNSREDSMMKHADLLMPVNVYVMIIAA
jgi:hypothetical protein